MVKEIENLYIADPLIHVNLNQSLIRAIYHLQIINQIPEEIIVYRLIKNAELPMSRTEILDSLYFMEGMEEARLNLILNYYNYIHIKDEKYYYSEKEKSIDNHISNIEFKTKYIQDKPILENISTLLTNFNRPLTINEIFNYIQLVHPVNKEDLKFKISNSIKFKSVAHNTYALAEWENYKELYYDFCIDLENFRVKRKISKRNWGIFKSYRLTSKGITLQEVGDEYKLTRERVRQIVKIVEKRILHPINKESFIKYIEFLAELCEKHGVLDLENKETILRLNEIFKGSDIIESINFLNIIDNRFTIIDEKYCCVTYEWIKMKNYLNYLTETIEGSPVSSIAIDDIYSYLKLEKCKGKLLLNLLIARDNRFYINKERDICYFAQGSIRGISYQLYIILDEIGEPTHYSTIAREYQKMIGESVNPRTVLSCIDRRKDIFTRTYTGIYALKEWGYEEHAFTMDLVIQLLEEKQCIMHYEDIYKLIRDGTQSKMQTMYNLIQTDNRIISLGGGYYGLSSYVGDSSNNLKYYSNIIDADNVRRFGYLLEKGINKYGYTYIIYRITEGILNSYTIKIPEVFNINLNFDIYGFDYYYNRYGFKFYKTEGNLYGINQFFDERSISEFDVIVIEIISPSVVRILTEREYKENYKVFQKEKYQYYIEKGRREIHTKEDIEVVDLKSLFRFGLKHGYVYYDDLKTIDLSNQYEDIFELMEDLDGRGVRFK